MYHLQKAINNDKYMEQDWKVDKHACMISITLSSAASCLYET